MMDQLTDGEKYLLLGKITGTLSPAEEAALAELFRTNAHARPAYEELVGALPAEEVATQFARRKANPTWRDLRAELQEQSPAEQLSVKRIPFYQRKWVAAACIIGVLATGLLLYTQLFRPGNAGKAAERPGIELKLANGQVVDLTRQQGTIDAGAAQLNNSQKSLSYSAPGGAAGTGINTLTVPIGLDYKVTLADGTEVWLNSATEMLFPLGFPGEVREVAINGEAYLKVAKDAAKPFRVRLPNSVVQVLGTEFNVNTYDSGTVKVALVEGSVNLTAPTGESRLAPGRQAILRANQPITQEAFNARSVLSWRKGLFYFNDASLEEISKVVPRWYGIRVAIDNPAILSRTFSGVINRNSPISVFMEDLRVISGIESHLDREGVLHFK